jgi:hypothetical protein
VKKGTAEAEVVMVIESRTIVGVAAAFALVGGLLWASAMLFSPPTDHASVEVVQVPERSWAVEIKDLGAVEDSEPTRTAANR